MKNDSHSITSTHRSPFHLLSRPIREILVIAAHADDAEIGCGGTLLELAKLYPDTQVHWALFSGDAERHKELEESAQTIPFRHGIHLHTFGFRDGYLPYLAAEVKDQFFSLRSDVAPDLVFTHRLEDAHQDHRFLSELTYQAYRNHLILEYEIPKFEGDLGQPNLYLPISAQMAQQKAENLVRIYRSQKSKGWFDQETFLSLMRIRGIESKSESGFAEAFHCRKLVWQLGTNSQPT